MKQVYIDSNGCAILRHETYRIAKFFELNSWIEVSNVENADLVVVTCCGVTETDEENAISMISNLWNKKQRNAIFIITGCLPKIDQERLLKKYPTAFLIGNDEMDKFDDIANGNVKISDVYYNVGATRKYYFDKEQFQEDSDLIFVNKIQSLYNTDILLDQYNYSTPRHYIWKESDIYQVRVSYGCGGNCSFCATKLGIGNFRSISIKSILHQITEGIDKGYTKIMLVGDEIGFYGLDIGLTLTHLIDEIYKINNKLKVGIRYIYPDMFVKYYPELKKYIESGFIYYFCSAIQTASPRLLKLMNRNPNITPFVECMKEINVRNYPIIKHSQIIVGFPTETDEDVVETLLCLMDCDFDYLNINPFSFRKGTKAYNLSKFRIDSEIIKSRCKIYENYLKINRSAKLYDKLKSIILNK